MTRVIVAGQEVADKISDLRSKMVLPSTRVPGCYDSETLCAFQRKMSEEGYLEAEIIQSLYGHSIRYASGLQNFGLIHTSRELGGTYDGAVEAAKRWQSADPTRRYVTTRPI